jgi:hypothetical protein
MLVLALCAANAFAGDAVEALLAKKPETEAQKAFAAGDRRYMVIPVCGKESGEVMPGWPLEDSSGFQNAINSGQRPISCADFGTDSSRHKFISVSRYAERYNRKLLELERKR